MVIITYDKNYLSAYLLICVSLAIGVPTYAQTSESAALKEQDAESFAAEGLTDADVTENLAAEALPTTDRFRFWWEEARGAAVAALTVNTEQKAERYRLRLHQLDRKMAACAEIGDTECVQRIEARIERLEEQTERFMARRQELREDMQERFLAWRERRTARHEEWREQASERRERRQKLLEERQERRKAAQEQRQEKVKEIRELQKNVRIERQELRQNIQEERQDTRQDLRQEKLDTRQQNQEKLIELRSQNVKNQLNTTRERVQQRTSERENISP